MPWTWSNGVSRHGSVQENAQNMYAAVLQHGSVQENAQNMHAAVLQHGGVQENAQIMHAAVLGRGWDTCRGILRPYSTLSK